MTAQLAPTQLTPPRAGRREWIGLSVLALACLLYVMDLTVLHLAIPQISEQLAAARAEILGHRRHREVEDRQVHHVEQAG